MKSFTTMFGLLVAVLPMVTVAKDFDKTCKISTYALGDNDLMTAECYNAKKHWTRTILDLDKCFANDDGTLKREDNGEYSHACKDCYLGVEMVPEISVRGSGKVPVISCECKNKKGDWKKTRINLNAYISNQFGTLCCMPHCGFDAVDLNEWTPPKHHIDNTGRVAGARDGEEPEETVSDPVDPDNGQVDSSDEYRDVDQAQGGVNWKPHHHESEDMPSDEEDDRVMEEQLGQGGSTTVTEAKETIYTTLQVSTTTRI